MPPTPYDESIRQSTWSEASVDKYLPLVKRIAGRLAISLPSHIDGEDLIGYGVFGLLDALQRFEPSRAVKFETYAGFRIRGAIIDGLRSMDWVPHSARQKVKKIKQAYTDLESQKGRTPTLEEVAGHLGMSMDDLNANLLKGQYMTLVSLDDNLNAENDYTPSALNILVDPDAEESFTEIEKEDQARLLADQIERLSEKEKLVVALYYREELTLKEIAAVMKLSESRVSQIHSQAILRLRGYLSRQKKNFF